MGQIDDSTAVVDNTVVADNVVGVGVGDFFEFIAALQQVPYLCTCGQQLSIHTIPGSGESYKLVDW
jgi:hypothetical protein